MRSGRAVALGAALGIIGLVAPWLIDNQFVLLLISLSGIAYLVALGLNLVMGFAGQVSLGHAALVGVGAYTSAVLTTRYELPFVVGFGAAGVLGGGVGLLLGIPALRLAGPYLAMATMAFNIVVQRLLLNWSDLTGGPDGLSGIPPPGLGPIVLDRRTAVYLVEAAALAGLWLARNLVHSRYGRALLAVRDDELAAAALGVDLYRAKLLVFALSAVFAGFAGSLYAHVFRHVSPISFGLEASLEYLLAVILAGPGTLVWPLAGAVFVTVVPQLPALQSLQELRLLVYGGLLLGAVLLVPRGLGGLVRRRARTGSGAGESAEVGELPTPRAPSPSDAPMLKLAGVTRRFGGVVALDGVRLVVEAGTVHGLIGPNGSGKTTAVNVVSGVLRPEGGRVQLRGRDVTGLAPHRLAELGAVRTFQNLRLFGELSVLDNIRVGLHTVLRASIPSVLLGLSGARRVEQESSERAAALGARLGLGNQLARPAADLPHGLQRRVELARALAARPALLLLDEPAAGLSQAELGELRSILREARRAGITILLIEHHLELVLELCDTVTVLDRGRVIATGRPDEVRRDPGVVAAYLGRAADEPGDAVVAGVLA